MAERPEELLTPKLFERYFELYYSSLNDLDKESIMDLLKSGRNLEIQFRTAAEKFRLIDDQAQQSVIVRYGEAEKSGARPLADAQAATLQRQYSKEPVPEAPGEQ